MTRQPVAQAVSVLQTHGKLGESTGASGSNSIYNCPFIANHGGRAVQATPSFYLEDTTGQWHCFSCGAKGPTVSTLFSRLMGITDAEAEDIVGSPKYEPEAILGLLGELQRPSGRPAPTAMAPFPNCVAALSHSDAANYLKSRNIPEWLAAQADLRYFAGHSLPTFTGKTGMGGQRIIIPIKSNGVIMGYSGRSIFANAYGPKYYRPIANVNNMLYNPLECSPKKSKHIFVVEGEFSALACLREGLPAACTFGATVSLAQMEFLVRFEQVIFLFDPDSAGDIGAVKAMQKMNGYCDIRKFNLPDGRDPADMPVGFGEVLQKMMLTPPKKVDNLKALEFLLGGI